MKNKETLEEVAKEKYPMFKGESYIGNNKKMLKRAAFINGAKWQQERMYSEEEVLEQLNYLNTMPSSKLDLYTDEDEMVTSKWFEQFKNK